MTAAPRWATRRTPGRRSFGRAVGKVAAALGTPLMPWQQLVADVALEVLDDGSWAYRTVTCSTPRQSGKTTLVGPVHLHRALTVPRPTYLTAQKRGDARDTWLDVVNRLRTSPLSELARIRESNGDEGVWLPGGGAFRVFAPTEDALHGKANSLVTVDEGWAFDLAQGTALEQAILPTFTTTGGQLWMVSTAGHGRSAWLRHYVDTGRSAVESGASTGHCHVEYGLDDATAAAVAAGLDGGAADRAAAFDLLLQHHPANGLTLDRGAIEQAARTMTTDQFLRAYGNVWTASADRVIPDHVWQAALVDDAPAPTPGLVALAFDVAVDRSWRAVAAAWRDSSTGPLRVDVIDCHPGTGWLAQRVRELSTRWRPVGIGYDRAGPAVDVADELQRGGLQLQPTNGAEYAAACVAFLSGITERRTTHPGRAALDDAVGAAATRPLGDGGWAWARRHSSASIAPLVAATVAGWTFDHRPPPAARPVVVSSRRAVAARRGVTT